jgi:hypothetical protein
MKFLNCFLFLRVIFALLDPDPESGSTDLIEIRIRNTSTAVNIHRKREKETAMPLKTVLQLASFLFLAVQLLLGLLQAGVPVSQDQLQLRRLIVSGPTLFNQLFAELADFVGSVRLPACQLHILRVERVDLEAQLLLLLDRFLLGSLQTEREYQ